MPLYHTGFVWVGVRACLSVCVWLQLLSKVSLVNTTFTVTVPDDQCDILLSQPRGASRKEKDALFVLWN